MDFLDLHILGSNSAIPISGRHPTAQVLHMANQHFLIDCGEGTQQRLRAHHIGFGRLQKIFISHLHGDHFYGLVPLLTTLSLLQRQEAIDIYGPQALEGAVMGLLQSTGARLRFPVRFHLCDPQKKALLYEDEHIALYSFPLKHSMPCTGFLFSEKERPRNLRPEALERWQIPIAERRRIKAGADFIDAQGRRIPNRELSDAPAAPLHYAFCTDTLALSDLNQFIPAVDLLYHESTFAERHRERAQETRHSTALQAAQCAKDCQVRHLLLGHFSVRYSDLNELLSEARSCFAQSQLALDGLRFRLQRNGRSLRIDNLTTSLAP